MLAIVSGRPADVLCAHVDRFNEAVRSHEYSSMLAGFAAEAEMVFQGIPVGPFLGRAAIAAAYASQPPRDEVRLLGRLRVQGDVVESAYAWASDPQPTGRMILTVRKGLIVRLVVTFDQEALGCASARRRP
jgi:hypothetical protein